MSEQFVSEGGAADMARAQFWGRSTRAIFTINPVRDVEKSERAGYPIYRDVVFAMVVAQGEKDAISRPADAEIKRQYKEDWNEFQEAVSRAASPLRVLPGITASIVAAFAELGIRSVEQLISAPIVAPTPTQTTAQKLAAAERLAIERRVKIEAAATDQERLRLIAQADAEDIPDDPMEDAEPVAAYCPEPLAKWRDVGNKYLAFRAEVLGQTKPRLRLVDGHLEAAA